MRAIGDPETRFKEDHLRMLRAVRFAARLGFTIEPNTLVAIRASAHCIGRISAERIRDELVRILTEGGARRGFELLDECGLLVHVLPEIKKFQGVQQPPEFHPEGDVWMHVLMMLEQLRKPTLHPGLGRSAARYRQAADLSRCRSHSLRWPCGSRRRDGQGAACVNSSSSNEDVDHVTALVANHMRFKDVRQHASEHA